MKSAANAVGPPSSTRPRCAGPEQLVSRLVTSGPLGFLEEPGTGGEWLTVQRMQPDPGNLRRLPPSGKTQGAFRVRIEDLLLPPNLPAGMDVLTLLSLAALLHKTTEDPEPVSVQREGPHWRISDGRHRAIAALIAGRVDVLAEETAMADVSGNQISSALDGPVEAARESG